MRTLQPWFIALPGFFLGAVAGLMFLAFVRHMTPFPGFSFARPSPDFVSSTDRTAWAKLPVHRRARISRNYHRYARMTAAEKRFVQDRWQYYRHLPVWRQQEMLREFDAFQRSHHSP